MPKQVAVILSDVHYDLPNLKLADIATRMAIDKANELAVPLIVAGDLHNTKANLRGECVTAMINTFRLARIKPYVMIGNHDRLNEKAPAHALYFLDEIVHLVEDPTTLPDSNFLMMIPYQHDAAVATKLAKSYGPNYKVLIMHQGCIGSKSGDYIQDKSAVTPADLAGFRVIGGHYHTRQSFDLPNGGKFDYIGNPYTLTYGEAQDPPKGFQILMSDGTLEFVPTNLRKHIVYKVGAAAMSEGAYEYMHPGINDLVWVKLDGTREELSKWSKSRVAKVLGLENFRLDLIPSDTMSDIQQTTSLTQGPLLDSLIEALPNTSDECKLRLKETWKGLCS